MEMIYSKEIGLAVLPETSIGASSSYSLTDALALYHRLKGAGKTSLFFESSERSIRYLIECPADIIDAIGGWTTEGIGHQYGQGHSLNVMYGWMKRLTTKVKEP